MTVKYTPNDEEVRINYIGTREEFAKPWQADRAGEFDRWLQKVKADTLREAAEGARQALSDGLSGHTSTYSVRRWLNSEADRLEIDDL